MRVYSNMPNDEFLYVLRQAAIANKASPLLLGKIDDLAVCSSQDELDEHCEKSWQKGYDEAVRDHNSESADLQREADRLREDNDRLETHVVDLEAQVKNLVRQVQRLQKKGA